MKKIILIALCSMSFCFANNENTPPNEDKSNQSKLRLCQEMCKGKENFNICWISQNCEKQTKHNEAKKQKCIEDCINK